MASTALNRSVVVLMTNKSAVALVAGDVVRLDTTTAASITTTTTAAYAAEPVGVALDSIAVNAVGLVCFLGYVPIVNLSSSASLGDFFATHTVAKQAARHASPSTAGDFGMVLGTGATPAAYLFGVNFIAAGGGGGAPTTAEYWVETADGTLSNEVVVGTTGITTAAEVSVQAAAKAGRLFLPDNGFWLKRDTGAAWVPWGPIFPLADPALQTFAWINQGGASVVTTFGGVYLLAPTTGAATVNFRIRKKSAPATPYTITVEIEPAIYGVGSSGYAIGFRQSSDGKLHLLLLQHSGTAITMFSIKYTDASTFSASYSSVVMWQSPRFLRIADNGTNRIVSWSHDGQNFHDFHTIGRTDFLTADEVLFCAQSNNATYGAAITVLSWKEG